ncbi:MAG: hypothetical protein KAS66_13280 [Candidatus Omnitrophica bacterium]|nr:hypothetical protein [Candidatus Omnitrophota bacterium]
MNTGAKYAELKDKNAVSIKKEAYGTAFIQKQFNPQTGEEKAPVINVINRDEILARKTALDADLADVNLLLADFDVEDAKEVTA